MEIDRDIFLSEWNNNLDYIVAHTSGSTGIPKEIRLLKNDMKESARATCRFFHINNNSTLVCPLSSKYIAGKMMIVRALVSGATLHMITPGNDFSLPYGVDNIDLIAIIPSQIPAIAEITRNVNINNVIIGGAPIPPDVEQTLYSINANIYATYGMTETCSHVALRQIKENNNIFCGLPGYTFKLGKASNLIIESSTQSFGCIETNDIVQLVDSNHFIWKGRKDNVIITGGLKVYPEEIEKKIADIIHHPFYVSSLPDQKWGQKVVIYIESAPFDCKTLYTILKNKLSFCEVPKEIIFESRFNYTSTGKLIRKRCN